MIRRFFRALWSALKTPWVVSLACALLLVLLVWLLGPFVAIAGNVLLESVTAKLAATLAIVFVWGLLVAILSTRQKKRDAANPAIAAKREQESIGRSLLREEVAHIRQRIKAAIKIVTTSNFYGSTSRSRYALPWYMVLGPQDCGKTSLLLNSGLQFPLNEQADRHLYKLKGTERCEILYANQAVFVDTPGKYAESNAESATHDLWMLLLRRLFRVRPAKALNGIIVCVSMRDMQEGDAARREHLARTIRTRLSEVLNSLRAYVPVYLVFTKCDAVPGFAQFFAHLSRTEREQIFGSPARSNTMEADTTRKELKELMQTLNAQIISKIHQERDCLARGELFRFPQELAALGPRLEDFIFEAFGPSRYHRPVMFRGFFFSSALSSRDIMASTAREGELMFQSGFQPSLGDYARGFFLLRLLEDCIIPEAGLAGADQEHVWLLRLRRFGAQLAGAVLLAGCVSLLAMSFTDNFSRLESLEAIYKDFSKAQRENVAAGDVAAILPELSHLEKAMLVYDREQDSALAYGLGLYQGSAVDKATESAYLGTLNGRFLPLVRQMAMHKITRSLDDVGALKAALRAYLMLCQPERMNEKFLREWLERQWSELYMGRADDQRTLVHHMDYLLAHGLTPAPPDGLVLEKARTALLKKPLAQLAYQQMQEEASENARSPYSFRAAIGEHMSPFSGDTYSIPYLYTSAGFEEYCVQRCPDIILGLTDDNWIFGQKPQSLSSFDVEKIYKNVRTMYFRDYTAYWSHALQNLRIETPVTMEGAENLAQQLTSGVSPVVLVLRELRKNTTFIVEDEESTALADAIEGQAVKKGAQKLSGVVGAPLAKVGTEAVRDAVAEERAKGAKAAQKDAQIVRQYFKPLDNLLDTDGLPAPALKATNDAMADVKLYFQEFNNSDNSAQRVFAALQDIASDKDDTLRILESAAERLPSPVRGWYSTATVGGLNDMLMIAGSIINTAYHESVFNVYNSKLKSNYPFRMDSENDSNLNDFAIFFKSNGVLDVFHNAYIKPFITNNGNLRSIMGRTLPISSKAIEQLQRATKVQDAFFISNNDLGISFLIEPYALDAALKQVDLSSGKKSLSYWHGPVQGANFNWPLDTDQAPEASFSITDIDAVKTFKSTRGDWAFFRLLQGGTIKHQEGNTCLVEMQQNGKWAQFLIQFRNKANPFDPAACSFSLPETLL